jgi:mannonate dehydratase
MGFTYSWRWFGPNDRITLQQIRQAGAKGVVSALHQIPVGEVWPVNDIEERKQVIENAGLEWVVVESLPVSEDIKKRTGNFLQHIENYKQSLINLGHCGINVVCYNFMPVLDWSRTNLSLKYDDGSESLGYRYAHFAAFDLFILKRQDAENDYPTDIVREAGEWFFQLNEHQKNELRSVVLLGLPGSGEAYTMEQFKEALASYKEIDRNMLKEHLRLFLSEVVPVAEQQGIRMAIHADDPPWGSLGLPRVVSTLDDLKDVIDAVDSRANGITLCTGSLGAGHFNDLPAMAKALAPRIYFTHLRNVQRDEKKNFREEYFFDGDIDMFEVIKTLLLEMKRRKEEEGDGQLIPVRPDHGHQMLGDLGQKNYPGYGLYGRMKTLAEIKGLTLGIEKMLTT